MPFDAVDQRPSTVDIHGLFERTVFKFFMAFQTPPSAVLLSRSNVTSPSRTDSEGVSAADTELQPLSSAGATMQAFQTLNVHSSSIGHANLYSTAPDGPENRQLPYNSAGASDSSLLYTEDNGK
jgi:hypothetical protein